MTWFVRARIRTFSNHARNTLDISIIPALRKVSHLPIIVDPSHSAGKRSMVIPHALAGIGAGGDGIIVEIHHNLKKQCAMDLKLYYRTSSHI